MTKKEAKPPILMIHGAFCGPWSLDGLKMKFQQAGYDVVVPCLRFHDAAAPPVALGTTGLADYAADLEEEIAALDAPPILVGHSMGGLLAQILAARRPVRALVLLAPSAPWGVPPSTLFEIGAAQGAGEGGFGIQTVRLHARVAAGGIEQVGCPQSQQRHEDGDGGEIEPDGAVVWPVGLGMAGHCGN